MPPIASTIALRRKLAGIVDRLAGRQGLVGSPAALAAGQVERWDLVVALVEAHPFATRPGLKRSAQWREAGARLAARVPCPELAAWVREQAEIAANIERGVRDLRPRKTGPCHQLVAAHVRARRQKAIAVERWLALASDQGADEMRGASPVFSRRATGPASGRT